jgi:4-amino-4-deoxy-L-arabinose transferase-like glycosyltransferase
MLDTSQWFVVGSQRYVHAYDTFVNAPLQYWSRGLVISFLGDNMLSMRILSSVSALLAVLALYRAMLHVAGRRAAFMGSLCLITTFQFLYLHSARTGELEPTVCLLLIGLAHTFTRCVDDPGRSLLPHHVCLALLFTVKTPVIAIPLIAEVLCFALLPAARARLADWLRLGVAILPFALSWHLYQLWVLWDMVPELTSVIASRAGVDSGSAPHASSIGHLFFYPAKIYFGAWPLVLLYPLAVISAIAAMIPGLGMPELRKPGVRIWLIYLLSVFVFYLTIRQRGPWYIVHAYPFFSALLGAWLAGVGRRAPGVAMLAALAGLLALGAWLRPEMLGFNPFAESAIVIQMKIAWKTVIGIPATPGVLVFAGLGFVALLFSARAAEGKYWPRFSVALAAAILAVAFVRACLPLAFVDHLSPVASLHSDLSQRALDGATIPLPIEVPPAHPWITDYYFLRDFKLRRVPGSREATGARWPVRLLYARKSAPGAAATGQLGPSSPAP